LQALPKGQYAGAQSLGLNYWQSMGLIILPQALKVMIPNIVNTYIGLFKDTTLVVIVGTFRLSRDHRGGPHRSALARRWSRPPAMSYAAVFLVICCYLMSRYARASNCAWRAPINAEEVTPCRSPGGRRLQTRATEERDRHPDRQDEQVVRRVPRAARHRSAPSRRGETHRHLRAVGLGQDRP
jgi:hypothetical protein